MTLSYSGQRQRLLRAKVINLLGGVCNHCGYSNPSILQIDHVNGKGGKKEPTSSPMYSRILRGDNIQDYQLLCPNCNWIKRHVNKEVGFNPNSQFRKAQRRAFTALGSKCSKCGQSDAKVLQIDHKFGGGYEERKRLSGASILVKARNNPELYQILCANCNWLKRVQNQEHVKTIENPKKASTKEQRAGIRFEKPSLKGYMSEERKEVLRNMLYDI